MRERSKDQFSGLTRLLGLLSSLLLVSCTPIDGPTIPKEPNDAGLRNERESTGDAMSVDEPKRKTSTPTSESKEKSGKPMDMEMDASTRMSAPKGTAMQAATASAEPDAGAMQPADKNTSVLVRPQTPIKPRPSRSHDPLPANQAEVPGEIADAEALSALFRWDQLPVIQPVSSQQQTSTDRGKSNASEGRLLPIFADGNRDLNNFICKSTDAKLGTPTIDFLFDKASCDDNYVHGVEIARVVGSGRMTRFWFTGSTPDPGLALSDEMLRIYVDDVPRPLVQVRLIDAVNGTAGEVFATPFSSGARNSLAWYYPVVFSSKLVVAIDNLHDMYFYEVNAALDEKPKERWAPLDRLDERDAAHATLASTSPRTASDTSQLAQHFNLAAGERKQVALQGPLTTNELQLRVPGAKLATLKQVTISVKWDKHETTSIDVPLLALFAAEVAPTDKNSLALATNFEGNDTLLSLRLPMPFQTSAEWALTNTGTDPIELDLSWIGAPGVPSATFGNLHVQAFETGLPAMKVEQTVADISGRGRFVGLCLDLAGDPEVSTLGDTFARPLGFGSGDVNFSIDGTKRTFSTSTDAYADDSFSFVDSPRSTAFAQSWHLVNNTQTEPQGQLSFCHWHVLGNEVDFAQQLTVTHEVAQKDASYVKLHRSIAYYYAP